jgi:hypothetical protein
MEELTTCQLGVDTACEMESDYTFADMRRSLVKGWGEIGERIAHTWEAFNVAYFADELRPIPIFLVPCTPFGHMVGWTCCQSEITHIALCKPREGTTLVADCGTLLHEMIHQFLHQRGACPKHAGQPWRDTIIRLHKQITGEPLVLIRQKVIKVRQADGTRRSARQSPKGAVTQGQIARWPHSFGLQFKPL